MIPRLFILTLLAVTTATPPEATVPQRGKEAAAIQPASLAIAVVRKQDEAQCYWMENVTGRYDWVPATWVESFESCFAMDSCDGGEGQSGGGCYKWAACPTCTRAPW